MTLPNLRKASDFLREMKRDQLAEDCSRAADALDAKDARIKELEGVLEAVDDLIQYQYSGTREAMTYLTQTCDRAREALK